MRISNKVKGAALFLALFLAGNAALSFALRPYSGSGAEMWRGFNKKSDVDMVFVGSSQCVCDINPAVVDEVTGLSSYNMGTNMQSIQSSFIAIKEAVNRKNVKSVVLLIDPQTLEMERGSNFRAEQCFVRNLSDTLPVYDRFRTMSIVFDSDFFTKPYSISYFFPWTYDRSSSIGLNIKEKIEGRVLNPDEHRDENGYSPSDVVYSTDFVQSGIEKAKEWSLEHTDLHVLKTIPENLETLKDIASFCNNQGVKLYVVSPPALNNFTYYDYFGYVEFTETVRDTLSEYGLQYYDLALLKDEYFETLSLGNYRDIGHMNNTGSTTFSKIIGNFILDSDKDKDISYMFKELYY
ncbi:hypothetical protein [Butyrivibrio sp. XBB1001]|uniref:hypothetical protein n=1 Tax=Butyrivibrio sp. XBB1001 TaxID=1280682 RepID=UPI0003FAC3D6|nr:hypothetical protein [Butyrivibrio sp. XBB1001]